MSSLSPVKSSSSRKKIALSPMVYQSPFKPDEESEQSETYGRRRKKPKKEPPPSLSKTIGPQPSDIIVPEVSGRGGTRRDVGLRTLCFRICSILQERKRFTFENLIYCLHGNENADKKFRRRVFDIMKVLKATEVIDVNEDGDRELIWHGMPNTVNPEVNRLTNEIKAANDRLKMKRKALQDLLRLHVARQRLVSRNTEDAQRDKKKGTVSNAEKVALPFKILRTSSRGVVHINANPEMTTVLIRTSHLCQLVDANSVVVSAMMEPISIWDLKRIVPESFCQYYHFISSSPSS